MASIQLPGWKPQERKEQKKDPLDMIQQGLQIAAAAYGIYSDSEKLDLARKTQLQGEDDRKLKQAVMSAELDKTKAETDKLRNPAAKEVKYVTEKVMGLDGKPMLLSRKETEPLPAGYRPYEEPKSSNPEEHRLDDIKGKAIASFDSNTKDYRTRYTQGKNIESLLQLGTPTAVAAATTQFMKLSGEVGAITDADIKRTGGSQDLVSQAKRIFEKGSTGKVLPEDIKAIKEAARVLSETNKSALLAEADNIAARTAKAYRGVNETDLREILGARDLLSKIDKEIYDSLNGVKEAVATAGRLTPTQFYSPQGAPFQQQQRQQQVKKSWFGGEAQAAPSPAPTGFDPDAYLGGR